MRELLNLLRFIRTNNARFHERSADIDDSPALPAWAWALLITASLAFAFVGLCAAGLI